MRRRHSDLVGVPSALQSSFLRILSEFDPVCGKAQPSFLVSLAARPISQLAALFRLAAESRYICFRHGTQIPLDNEWFHFDLFGQERNPASVQ